MESEEVETARRIADTIHAGFVDYVAGFNLISRRARSHFERREWPLQEANAGERLLLHNERVLETVAVVKALLGDDARPAW